MTVHMAGNSKATPPRPNSPGPAPAPTQRVLPHPSVADRIAAGKKDAPPTAKPDPKDAWKERFDVREIETGLAAVDKVEVVKGGGGLRRTWRRSIEDTST